MVFGRGFLGAQKCALFFKHAKARMFKNAKARMFKHAKARMRTLALLSSYQLITEGGMLEY